jgi:hypothetical protein
MSPTAQVRPNGPSSPALLQRTLKFNYYYYYYYSRKAALAAEYTLLLDRMAIAISLDPHPSFKSSILTTWNLPVTAKLTSSSATKQYI